MNNTTCFEHLEGIAQMDETTLTTCDNDNTYENVTISIIMAFIALCILSNMTQFIVEMRIKSVYQGYYTQFIRYDCLIMKYEKRILNQNKILKKAKKKQDTETIKRTKAQIILLKSEMKDLYSWRNYFQANLINTLNKMDKKNIYDLYS